MYVTAPECISWCSMSSLNVQSLWSTLCVGGYDVLPLVNLRLTIFPQPRSCSMAEWACSVLFACISVCVFVRVDKDRGPMVKTVRAEKRGCTCSILLSGFSSSSVKTTSSLSKPYSPSPERNIMKDYISVHIKLIAMLHCRLQPNHKSSEDFTHCTHTHTSTKRSCMHLIAQAHIYFQLFCVITLTHQHFISQLR